MIVDGAFYTSLHDVHPGNKPQLEGVIGSEDQNFANRAFVTFVGDAYTSVTEDRGGRLIDEEYDYFLTRGSKTKYDFRMFWSDTDGGLWFETREGEPVEEQVAILEAMVEKFREYNPDLQLRKLKDLIL
ncbi:hypothetical protein HOD38_03145 [archaeon]|jgi:hypothetical protein|nr:hypothetical protein [archaeon]MBT4397235.1 hypothetical protein [archaeon]MBT4440615.1 hypothetical protein [archaeon]